MNLKRTISAKLAVISTLVFASVVLALVIGRVSASRLTQTSPGVYRQVNAPSKGEADLGVVAIRGWKIANKAEKAKLAEDIVVGKALDGLTKDEVVSKLGAFLDDNPDYSSYDIFDGGGSGLTLNIVFDKDKRVIDSYIARDG